MQHYPITPTTAPRMTAGDRFRNRNNMRPPVARFFAFRDEVRAMNVQVQNGDTIAFHIPMPESWSARRKKEMCGKPHTSCPDNDNLLKALLDSVFFSRMRDESGKKVSDQHIYDVRPVKFWAYSGGITIKRGEPYLNSDPFAGCHSCDKRGKT